MLTHRSCKDESKYCKEQSPLLMIYIVWPSSFIYIIIWYSVPKGYDVWENEVTDVLVITLQGYAKFIKSKFLFRTSYIFLICIDLFNQCKHK